MSAPPRLSIVLPCYNEADNIPWIMRRFREVLKGREDVEAILVNNGSRDRSAAVLAEELGKPEHAFARTVTVAVNQGYGFGIMAGIRESRGDVLAWTHADLQTDPNDVLLAHGKFARQPDMGEVFLKGRRIKRNPLDAVFTLGMAVISSVALGEFLFDINAQPKMFHRSFLERMKNPPDDFSLDLYALYLARRLKMTILEQPVSFAKRRHGEAKGGGSLRGKIRLIRRTWAYILKLRAEIKGGIR